MGSLIVMIWFFDVGLRGELGLLCLCGVGEVVDILVVCLYCSDEYLSYGC